MTDTTRLKGSQYAFSTSDVLVSLKHLPRVRQALGDHALPERSDDRDDDLRMARVRIRDLTAAAQAFHEFIGDDSRPPAPTVSPAAPGSDEASAQELDDLLRGLRGYFRGKYAGWTPLIGKNRLVGSVIGGGGKVSHGGGGPLRMAGEDDHLDDRAGGEPEAWRDRGAGVLVGVLDTAMTPLDWYAGAWTAPAEDVLTLADGEAVRPEAGHATFVAGLVLQQAPACTIISRRVLHDDGEAELWDVARAIVSLARTRPDVMNLSFVCFTEDAEAPLALAAAIDRVDPETVIVAAAGNHGDLPEETTAGGDVEEPGRKPAWPAAFDRVVAVGSSTFGGERSSFTPEDVDWIDAYAPGELLLSTYLRHDVDPTGVQTRLEESDEPGHYDGLARWTGSSFSAASVSGAIAARVRPGRKSAMAAWRELGGDALRRREEELGPPVFVGPDHLRYSWRPAGS